MTDDDAGELADVATAVAGDEIRVQGEWLDIFKMEGYTDGRITITTDEGRVFLTHGGVQHRIRRHDTEDA